MSHPNKVFSLNLDVQIDGDDNIEEVDLLTRHLLREIRSLDVETAELAQNAKLANGAKTAVSVDFGKLLVDVLPATLPALIIFLQTWVMRAQNRTIKIRTQHGESSVEIEYSPQFTDFSEIQKNVEELTKLLSQQDKK